MLEGIHPNYQPRGIDERIDAAISNCCRTVQSIAQNIFSSSHFTDSFLAGTITASIVSLVKEMDMQDSMIIIFSSALSYSSIQLSKDA